jgi:hypothetical protein
MAVKYIVEENMKVTNVFHNLYAHPYFLHVLYDIAIHRNIHVHEMYNSCAKNCPPPTVGATMCAGTNF